MRKQLYRSKNDRVFLGLLGGLAEYFNVSSNMIRFIFILLMFAAVASPVPLYLIASIFIPTNPYQH